MSAARLDDPDALTELLTAWSAPPALAAALSARGFDTLGKLACATSSDLASEDQFLGSVLPGESLSASVVVACCRRLLRHSRDCLVSAPPAPDPSRPGSSKLTPVELRDIRAKFQTNYPGELLTQESTPSGDFLSLLRQQLDSGVTCWIPWRHRSSEADALHWLESRRPRSDGQLLRSLLADQDITDTGPSALVNMSAPIEPTLRRALSMLATALAMLGDVHLLVIKRFNDKFISLALARPADQSLRSPTLAEVLAADKAAWSSITALLRDHNWSLSDALNEVAFCRQDLPALQPRPRPAQPPAPLKPRPTNTADSPKGGGRRRKESSGSANAPDTPAPAPKKPKRDTATTPAPSTAPPKAGNVPVSYTHLRAHET